MKKRVGTILYDTDKAILVDTLQDGIQVYRKKNSPLFFIYNPNAGNKHEMFFDLSPEDAEKYLAITGDESRTVSNHSKTLRFSDYNIARIKRLANSQGMSMAQLILMLVDRYEQEQTDRGN